MEHRNSSHRRGTAIIDVVVVLGVVAVAGWLGKGFFFSKDKERAKESEAATVALIDAQKDQSSAVAASVTAIGVANDEAPESPSKAFIEREVPEALALLPKPPESALKAAETRRMAVMEGRLHEANRLYAELRDANMDLKAQRDAAIQRRIDTDMELIEAAKSRASSELRQGIIMLVAAVAAIGWFTRAKQSVPIAVVGQAMAQANRPHKAVQELDAALTRGQQKAVRKAVKLNAPDGEPV
jgi:flagellar basal body-associated protein FliL